MAAVTGSIVLVGAGGYFLKEAGKISTEERVEANDAYQFKRLIGSEPWKIDVQKIKRNLHHSQLQPGEKEILAGDVRESDDPLQKLRQLEVDSQRAVSQLTTDAGHPTKGGYSSTPMTIGQAWGWQIPGVRHLEPTHKIARPTEIAAGTTGGRLQIPEQLAPGAASINKVNLRWKDLSEETPLSYELHRTRKELPR